MSSNILWRVIGAFMFLVASITLRWSGVSTQGRPQHVSVRVQQRFQQLFSQAIAHRALQGVPFEGLKNPRLSLRSRENLPEFLLQ
ncbi:hypothetical protein G7K_2067-t1 [Saitoella complicata NRRL Y-17804]|uniref:Uncharacterized protein n=1 Tax=Saitoella complicata (strain BCRC 22490 / CBS 7301 / JCM 7358 / NBRC 10748 / NRRL Y-17804) TaxID=698492 RepID=A0A0E9NDU4_SAICN|nr:hypothetical protein G7K_2067-t1 [Saitoella complicata NRRL Y-17804]